ncbi:MAG TPA: hypothetical protein VNV66_09245, partial [Pilimelia sp.]|nr:hypothetical protein [Pilimelia sp.]
VGVGPAGAPADPDAGDPAAAGGPDPHPTGHPGPAEPDRPTGDPVTDGDRADRPTVDADRAEPAPADLGGRPDPEIGPGPAEAPDSRGEPAEAPDTRGEPAEAPGTPDEPAGDLVPGAVPADGPAGLWPDGTVERLRGRWQDLQLRFVDDPRGTATEARALVGEAVEALTAALAERRTELDSWTDGDTEQLRVALRRYRDFLEQLFARR